MPEKDCSGESAESSRSRRLQFLDFTVPVVLEDSPILYSYIMGINNKINPNAGVEATIRDVSRKMRVPKGLQRLVKNIFFLIHLFFKIINYSKSLKLGSHSVVGRFDTFF